MHIVAFPKIYTCVCVCVCVSVCVCECERERERERDPLCEIQTKVSKSNYEITSIKV